MCPSTHAVTNHVNHPVLLLAQPDKGVQCPCGCPHDVRACLVVLRILYSDAAAVDDRTHQSFREVVAGVVIEVREVLLHDVVHDVVDTRLHLVLGYGHRELRIEDRELRHQTTVEHMPHLESMLCICNHSAGVHLRACASHCQHTTHRNPTAGHRLPVLEVILPRVTIVPSTSGYGLAVVNGRATAHAKDEIHILLASYVGSL